MLQAELTVLEDRKAALNALDESAHRLIADHDASTPLICTALNNGLANLRKILDATLQK